MTLEEYYKTPHWKKLSKKLIASTNTCQICGEIHYHYTKTGKKILKRRFTCHHKTYKNLFKETSEDIMILCWSCHEVGHHIENLVKRNSTYTTVLDEWKNKTGWSSEKRIINKKDELVK